MLFYFFSNNNNNVFLIDLNYGGQSHRDEVRYLRKRYYSVQVYAQTQVHFLFLSFSTSDGTVLRHDRRDYDPDPRFKLRASRFVAVIASH